jgi:protein FRA10AC1
MTDYVRFYGGGKVISEIQRKKNEYLPGSTEAEVLAANHRFLREEHDDAQLGESWEQRLAKRYYDRLFKEYALADLSRYREGKVAMRWRTQAEVVAGKGQFECGNVACQAKEGLKSWEVNFGYVEGGEKKNALVKIRLCGECSVKLHWKKAKEREVEEREREREEKKRNEVKRTQDSEDEEDEVERDSGERRDSAKGRKRTKTDGDASASSSEAEEPGDDQHDNEDEPPVPSKVYKHSEASKIWSAPRKEREEEGKTREQEFDEFFEGLFQ